MQATTTQTTTTTGPELLGFRYDFDGMSLCPGCAVSNACGPSSAFYADEQGDIDLEDAQAFGMTVNRVGSSTNCFDDGLTLVPQSVTPDYMVWEECAECGKALADHEIEGDDEDL